MAKKKKSNLAKVVAVDATDGPSKAERRKWEVEDAVRTMQKAEEIKKDPTMMKDVKTMARMKMNELKKIC